MAATQALSRTLLPADPVDGDEATSRRYVDAVARLFLPVCNGTHFNGNGGAASTSLIQTRCRSTRKLLRVIAGGADELQVEWANTWTSCIPQSGDASCEIAAPNTVTVRMAVEYPAGNPRLTSGSAAWNSGTAYAVRDQVTHGGNRWVALVASTNVTPAAGATWRQVRAYTVRWDTDTDADGTVVFAAGQYLRSVPIPLAEMTVAGDCLAVLGTFDSGGSSNYLPYAGTSGASNTVPFVDWVVDSAGGMPAAGSDMTVTGVTTQTNGNTTTANSTNQPAWMKIPFATAVTGNIPTQRCVALVGDSLVAGSGGDIRDGEPAGMFVRAVNGTSWWRVAQGGNRAECYAPGNAPWQMSCIARCSAAVTDLGINDMQVGLTFAQTKAAVARFWQELAATGIPVYAGLYTPISASSDSWATVANQSRYTAGGTIATTQFPGDDATFLTSVYGQMQLWLGQDGAPLTPDTGVTVKVGQAGHSITALLDWRGLLSDPPTSWKWNAGYTADGGHPNALGSAVAAAYLSPSMEPVLLGRQQSGQAQPAYSPVGEDPTQNMRRSEVTGLSATPTTGSLMTVIDVSAGRFYYGLRLYAGTTGQKSWTLLAGMDGAKMKVVASGTTTPAVADTVVSIALSGAPLWFPPGTLFAVVLTTPATNAWGGALGRAATQHVAGNGCLLAGTSADTAVLTGTISLYTAVKFTSHAFRAWAAMY